MSSDAHAVSAEHVRLLFSGVVYEFTAPLARWCCGRHRPLLLLLLLHQAVLDRYQALLQEYRLHKSALGSWFGAVQAATQRPPQLLDAQATGDEALVAR
jgi:hypothetical protein